MQANGETNRSGVWPTVWGSFVIVALVVSLLSLAVGIEKTNGTSVVAAGSVASAGPGIQMGMTPADSFKARDPNAPIDTAPAGTVHKVTLTIEETPIEIAPGVTQLMWTYNGTVPGPILRGKVGDTFEITLKNDGTTSHSIDFHASKVAPNVTMRMIQPGESLVYKFTADHSGIFMYHCGTAPVLEHIGMGMYGRSSSTRRTWRRSITST